MGDENPIRTLRDYSKPSHKGYRNTIKLLVGNNVAPLRSDTIQLVQNGCSFHGLWSEDPNQHLKDFLRLMDSLDLDGENRKRTLLRLFKFSLRDQANNWLEHLLAGSITTREDLTTHPEQAFVEYASSRIDKAGGRLHKGGRWKVMFIKLTRKNDDFSEGEPKEEGSTITEGVGAEYFDIFPTRSELAYHKYLMCGLILSIFQRNPIIPKRCPSNLKIPCNIMYVYVERAYTDPKSPLNIMTRMMYNWIKRIQIVPRQNTNEGVCNFTGRIKGMHVIVGNFTYVIDFMIIEDISSIIDPRLSQVVLRRPFVEISNMTHDPPKGVVRFTNRNDEVSYKIPHKIE
nr:MAK10-like protein [Tanacetum cinerariifolium]